MSPQNLELITIFPIFAENFDSYEEILDILIIGLYYPDNPCRGKVSQIVGEWSELEK